MTEFANGKALVIGVASYSAQPLPNVANDANDLADLLRDPAHCGYLPTNVHVLVDGEANKFEIERELAWLAHSADVDDTVVIYFSGHGDLQVSGGAEQGYLVPIDAEFDETKLLSGDEITAALRQIKAKRVTLVMDACHAGATGTPKGVKASRAAWTATIYDRLASGEGRVILASCRPEQSSYTYEWERNSVFTEALLDSLRGDAEVRGDGLIHVLDVFHCVSEAVRRRQPDQDPVMHSHGVTENFPLALFRGGQKGITRVARPSARQDDWWKRLEQLARQLYPQGPSDSALWSRSGGDFSLLRDSQNPRGAWHYAIQTLRNGGGGRHISADVLMAQMNDDFANNAELTDLRRKTGRS